MTLKQVLKTVRRYSPRRITHAKAEELHALKRLRERYGLSMHPEELRRLKNEITKTQKAEFVRKNRDASIFKIRWGYWDFFVVYKKDPPRIVTFLKPEWVKTEKGAENARVIQDERKEDETVSVLQHADDKPGPEGAR